MQLSHSSRIAFPIVAWIRGQKPCQWVALTNGRSMGHLNGNGTCWTAAVASTGSSSYSKGQVTRGYWLDLNISVYRFYLISLLNRFNLVILLKVYLNLWPKLNTFPNGNWVLVTAAAVLPCHCHFIMQWKRFAFGSVRLDSDRQTRTRTSDLGRIVSHWIG